MFKHNNFRLFISLLTALISGHVPAANEISPAASRTAPLRIESNSWQTSGQDGVRRFEGNVRLTKGHMALTADRLEERSPKNGDRNLFATGTPAELTLHDPEEEKTLRANARRITFQLATNTLVLEGDARLATTQRGKPDLTITASSIRMQIVDEHPSQIHAKGAPLVFSRTNPDGKAVEAEASSLALDETTGVVTLQQASIRVGNSQTQAPSIMYNGRTGDVRASRQGDERPTVIVEWPESDETQKQPDTVEKKP
jgi:lipopolysaccharide transport protein LptA